jgi:predicted PurR-regulated permease PerM
MAFTPMSRVLITAVAGVVLAWGTRAAAPVLNRFLLGFAGAILATPLATASRKFSQNRVEAKHRLGPAGRECPG